MPRPACKCPGPTASCPLYGFMKGRKWDICRSDPGKARDAMLKSFERLAEMRKGERTTDPIYFQRSCCG